MMSNRISLRKRGISFVEWRGEGRAFLVTEPYPQVPVVDVALLLLWRCLI